MYRRHQRPRTFSDGQEKPLSGEAPGQAAFPKEVVLMSFDGLVTRAVVHELQDALAGGRVTKIYQPGEYELLFHIRSQGETHRLILSAHPAYPRFHLTRERTDNPKEPPMFCMLLRKHLEGGIVHRVKQVEMDRIVHVDIRTRNELGDEVIRRLVVEIMGRHSNVILIDPETETIFDAVRRVTPAVSQYRQVVPGARYRRPPEQNKRHPLSIDRQTFFKSLDFNRGRMDKQLVERFAGLGPLVAREIVHRAGIGSRERLWEAFSEVMSDIQNHRYHPNRVVQGGKTHFSVVDLTHLEGQRTSFPSVSGCLEAVFAGRAEQDRVRQQAQDLIRKLKNEIAKNEKKLGVLKREAQEAEKADTYRIWGELLTAYMHEVKSGADAVTVTNYYEPDAPPVTIPLEPHLSPSENAQRFFKKYNKLKAAQKWSEEQIAKARSDIQYLESVLASLENASPSEVAQIREELEEEGWLRPSPAAPRKKKKEPPKPASFRSSEGIPILVGKNNKQNDYLTHRLASSTDTWLHTKEIPGSHVVIRSRRFGEATLREAAILAAYFSRARNSSQVPVDYTLVKHVRKPAGARPGFVIYDHQKTLYVTPDEDTVRKLEETREKE